LLFAFTFARAQSWAPLNNQPAFPAGTALLLTDGTVMVQQMTANGYGTANWWRLTPDLSGSYQNGTWSQLASMPNITDPNPNNPPNLVPYAPLYYASAVLPDGRVVVMGGEYNGVSPQVETAAGAIYDPVANSWTTVASPVPPFNQGGGIGDASGMVLANGTFMLGPCCNSSNQWLLNISTMTWTLTGTNKADGNSEESWTLLPNGNILTVDTSFSPNSEVYNPGSGSWSSVGNTPVALPGPGLEIGPGVLRPDGSVFTVGGNSDTAVYGAFGGWSPGPQIPNGGNGSDVPAALLTNGRVLVETADHPLNQNTVGTHFYEFDGINLTPTANPPAAGSVYGFVGRMLVLPTGEIMSTNQTNQVELYTSSGTYSSAWQPTISSISSTSLGIGLTNYTIYGTQFNGLSQGAMYGDDAQSATNYPLIRITNNATQHVFYVKTHTHSTMAVATGSAQVSTQFDVPGNVELGDSMLQVVANGIPSNPYPVTVFAPKRRACCVF
jgi:hypothetical protein